MKAEAEGISILLQVIEEMKAVGLPVRRTLALHHSSVKEYYRVQHLIQGIQLNLLPVSEELRLMSFRADKETGFLDFTEAGLPYIVSSLKDWRDGREDFCIWPCSKNLEFGAADLRSLEMWFWVNMMALSCILV